jgi:uncharacterized protein (DUF1778 family)
LYAFSHLGLGAAASRAGEVHPGYGFWGADRLAAAVRKIQRNAFDMKKASSGKKKVSKKRGSDLIPWGGVLTLSQRDWEVVIQTLEHPPEPNDRLKRAFAEARKTIKF